MTYTNQAALVPLLRADLGVTDVQAGLLPTALFISSVLTMLTTATLADRIGAKRVNVIGLALCLASNLIFAAAPTYAVLLLAKVVGGIGSGVAFVGGVRYIVCLYGGVRPHFGQGVYGAGYPLGSALSLQVMPALALAFGGWRGAFVSSTTVLLGVLIVYSALAPAVGSATVRGNIGDALRNANARWCAVEHAAGFGLSLATGTWVSVFFLREFGSSLVAAGALGSVILVTAVVMRPIGGYLIARGAAKSLVLMRSAQAANLVGLALVAFPGRPIAVALGGVIIVGLGVSLPYAAVFNTAAASLPRAPGAAQSLTAVGGTIGAVVGAPLMGAAVERFDFTAAWVAIAVIPALALVGTFRMRGEEDLTDPD
jgi:predicted MFS family arabinose efflux permease